MAKHTLLHSRRICVFTKFKLCKKLPKKEYFMPCQKNTLYIIRFVSQAYYTINLLICQCFFAVKW